MQGHFIFRKIDALILLELFDDPFDQSFVDVVAAEVRVAVGRFHFNDAFANFEDRNVVRASAEVEHCDRFVFLFVETISQGRRRRLVHDTHDFETGDLSRVLCRLAL